MESLTQYNPETARKWKILIDLVRSMVKPKEKESLNTLPRHLYDMLVQIFESETSNVFFPNVIHIDATISTDLDNRQKNFILISYSFLENLFRLLFKMCQNTLFNVEFIFYKDPIVRIFEHLRINNGELYSYMIDQLFSLLIELNQVFNNYLKNHDESHFLDDIPQFKLYTGQLDKTSLADYLIEDFQIPLNDIQLIRTFYVQLLQIITELAEPINDMHLGLSDKVCQLIELNLICSTIEMDSALVNFVSNSFFVFNCSKQCFQRYFVFACSITHRHLKRENSPISQHQLDKLWNSLLDLLIRMRKEEKTIQLMFYIIDNSMNLQNFFNTHFLQHTLPMIVIKVFDKHHESQRDKVSYHSLVTRILDFYSNNVVESHLQSEKWCKLIKFLLIEDWLASFQIDSLNYSYLFKFWEFLNQNADKYLFKSPNLLLKFINYANNLLPCFQYIILKDMAIPEFYEFKFFIDLIDVLLYEFKNPKPSIESLKDELIEHIYLILFNFIKLFKLYEGYKLKDEQTAVFYLPWHECKLKFVKEQQQVLNDLSRRSFVRSDQVLKICLSAIAEFPTDTQHTYQIDFFDHILSEQFNELEELINPIFVIYLQIAYRYDMVKFDVWLIKFVIENEDKRFISSCLGNVCCLLFGNCEIDYEINTSEIQIDKMFLCRQCDSGELNGCENQDNIALMKLIRDKFKSYLDDNLDHFNTLVNESSKQFFKHIDIDEQLIQNVLNLFDLVDSETQKSLHKLLGNMFNSLKIEKERFIICFRDRFLTSPFNHLSGIELITKLENIALMCNHFPKYKLEMIIYLLENGVLQRRNAFNTSIVLRKMVFRSNENLSKYFVTNKIKIWEHLISKIIDQNISAPIAFNWLLKLTQIITKSDNYLNFTFTEALDVILPCLIKNRTKVSELLDYLLYKNESIKFTTVKDLIFQFLEPITLYFVRNMNIQEIESAIEYTNKLAKADIREFFAVKGQVIYSLLFEYCSQEKSINYLLSVINSDEFENEQQKIKRKYVDFNQNPEALSLYLAEKMGGYLLNLNSQFITNDDIKYKITLLKSLDRIIKNVSKKTISNYFERLIGILRSAFKHQPKTDDIVIDYTDYVHRIHTSWDTLISNCHTEDLPQNLSLICKNLMDLLPIDTAGVSNVFEKLIVRNQKILEPNLKELHFIPSNVRLMNATNQVIQKHMFKMPANDRDIKTFESVLNILAECLKVENPEIKFFHYRKLLQVLSENEKCLRKFCSSGNDLAVQPIISRLIAKLINDSKMDDNQLRSVIGECLGEFGAIDPGRLDMGQLSDPTMNIPFFYDVNETDFAILIINKLVVYFDLLSESKLHDCINFALQELLKHYSVVASPTNQIWIGIQPKCQSICQQLFKARFVMKDIVNKSIHPVYKEVQKFSDWIIKLCISLIEIVRDDFAKKVFNCLRAIINNSTSFAEYILPFIIVVILISGESKDMNFVFEEIDYLIQYCLPKHSVQSQTGQNIENKENYPDETMKSQENIVLYEAKSEQFQCVHTLFSLLDFLTNWRKMIKNHLNLGNKGVKQKRTIDKIKLTHSYEAVDLFLNNISKERLSILASSCQSFDRALMYLEEYVFGSKNRSEAFASNYDNLQKLYVALEEPDGVEGIIACRKEKPSLYNSILSHEVNGELQEAISCCEKANKIYPNELNYSKIYLKCLLLLGHENTAKIFATNSIQQRPDYQSDLQPFIVEAAWKMGEWDKLEDELKKQEFLEPKFEVDIGNLFIAIRNVDRVKFDDLIRECRLNEVNQISVSSAGNRAYTRNYPKLIHLHMLNEIEHFYKNCFINLRANRQRVLPLIKRFNVRTKNVQTSVRTKEPIINLQRILLNILASTVEYCNFHSELAELWLSSAKLARKSNNFQSAYNFLLEIQILEQQGITNFSEKLRAQIIIEKAKYHWQKDTVEDKERALKELNRGIDQLKIQLVESNFEKLKPHFTFAKLHLLYNNYSEKTLNLDSDKLKENYSKIISCYDNWEESYYNLGIYFDNIAKTIDEPQDKAEYLYRVINNLGESLKYGSKHVYESMPKLLTSWCDLGDYFVALSKTKSSSKGKNPSDLIERHCIAATKSIRNFLGIIPPHNFYTAISQLTSRMCHPLNNISDQISEIIRVLLKMYPHQTIWLILSSLLSENKVRNEKFQKLTKKPEIDITLLNMYIDFGKALCKVCLYEAEGKSFNLNTQFPHLKKTLKHCQVNHLKLLVPFQCFMNVQLPDLNQDADQPKLELKNNLVFIEGFGDNAFLLKSLVKPKLITIRGSDGKTYMMMCKPKDDLRKDNRTMEFNNLVNRHLRKDSETRKRNLFIKTYTVVPLRHDCGLIEWINDLEGYRSTVVGTYLREIDDFKGSYDKLLPKYPKKSTSVEESLEIFRTKFLPVFPPIFHKFFLIQYQNPTAWYNARMNYVRSCAVMSIVGYIIGLGDRHGENILVHLKSGNLVHVDFNCIFNKGAELDVPEVLPFRLTHNMVDAMGPTGCEGVFRKTCESTLRVMREQREALMSVLTTFVHDPLIEWNKGSRANNSRSTIDACEQVNKTALENLDRIMYRLNGLLGLDVKSNETRSMNRSAMNRSVLLNQTIDHNKIPISVN